jgi:hypothetical protein
VLISKFDTETSTHFAIFTIQVFVANELLDISCKSTLYSKFFQRALGFNWILKSTCKSSFRIHDIVSLSGNKAPVFHLNVIVESFKTSQELVQPVFESHS